MVMMEMEKMKSKSDNVCKNESNDVVIFFLLRWLDGISSR